MSVNVSVNLLKYSNVSEGIIMGYLERDYNKFRPELPVTFKPISKTMVGTFVGLLGLQKRKT